MAEYIEKDAFIRSIEGNPLTTESVKSYIRVSVKKFPAADVVEVRHGEWVPHSIQLCLYSCSNCHCVPRDKTPYCPICGAKMDGGDHDAAD